MLLLVDVGEYSFAYAANGSLCSSYLSGCVIWGRDQLGWPQAGDRSGRPWLPWPWACTAPLIPNPGGQACSIRCFSSTNDQLRSEQLCLHFSSAHLSSVLCGSQCLIGVFLEVKGCTEGEEARGLVCNCCCVAYVRGPRQVVREGHTKVLGPLDDFKLMSSKEVWCQVGCSVLVTCMTQRFPGLNSFCHVSSQHLRLSRPFAEWPGPLEIWRHDERRSHQRRLVHLIWCHWAGRW